MNKHFASTKSKVLNDIIRMNKDQLIDLYGISLEDDGTVYDPTEMKTFSNLREWANYIAELEEEDNYGSFQKRQSKYTFDDEY
jgi:hypothetical protein